MPTIATLALGTALLVPLRDDRRGKRATLGAAGAPLRADFAALAPPVTGGRSIVAWAARGDGATSPTLAATGSGRDVCADADVESCEGRDESVMAIQGEASNGAPAPAVGLATAPAAKGVADDSDGSVRTGEQRFRDTVASVVESLVRRIDGVRRGARWSAAPEPNTFDASQDHLVVERSFAGELANLLAPPPSDESMTGTRAVPPSPSAPPPAQPPEATIPLIVRAPSISFQRVLPLTRLPLRARVQVVSWPSLLETSLETGTSAERHAVLEALARSQDPCAQAALVRAYREEDDRGRLLALRALMRGAHPEAHAVFTDALRSGTDEERALAVDALIGAGDRDGVRVAFSDRVDAIAAKAALASLGTVSAQQYRKELAPFMDAARIDVVLELLAGIIE